MIHQEYSGRQEAEDQNLKTKSKLNDSHVVDRKDYQMVNEIMNEGTSDNARESLSSLDYTPGKPLNTQRSLRVSDLPQEYCGVDEVDEKDGPNDSS